MVILITDLLAKPKYPPTQALSFEVVQYYTIITLEGVIYSTAKSSNILHTLIQTTHLQYTLISWEVLFVVQQTFLKDKVCQLELHARKKWRGGFQYFLCLV